MTPRRRIPHRRDSAMRTRARSPTREAGSSRLSTSTRSRRADRCPSAASRRVLRTQRAVIPRSAPFVTATPKSGCGVTAATPSPRRYPVSYSSEAGFRERKALAKGFGARRMWLWRRPLASSLSANLVINERSTAGPPKMSRLEKGSAKVRGALFALPTLCPKLQTPADQGRLSRAQVVERAANARYLRCSGRIRSPLSPPRFGSVSCRSPSCSACARCGRRSRSMRSPAARGR